MTICEYCQEEVGENEAQPCTIESCSGTLCQDCSYLYHARCKNHNGRIARVAGEALDTAFKYYDEEDVKQMTTKPTPEGNLLVVIGQWEVLVVEVSGELKAYTD